MLQTQESDIAITSVGNEVQKAGNGFGIKKRSFALDVKIAILEELDVLYSKKKWVHLKFNSGLSLYRKNFFVAFVLGLVGCRIHNLIYR